MAKSKKRNAVTMSGNAGNTVNAYASAIKRGTKRKGGKK